MTSLKTARIPTGLSALPGPLLSIVFSHLSAVDCARLRMALRHAQEVPKTQDELLVQRILLIFAKHPLAGWGLELCLCGGNKVVFCTRMRFQECKFSCDYDWKYFKDVYLRQYLPDYDQHDIGYREEPIWYEDSTTLAVIFAEPQRWVTQLRLELSKRPPLRPWHGLRFPAPACGDKLYAPPRWDLVLLEHQVRLPG